MAKSVDARYEKRNRKMRSDYKKETGKTLRQNAKIKSDFIFKNLELIVLLMTPA